MLDAEDGQVQVRVNGVDVFHPNTGEVRSDGPEGIACWFIDTDYNERKLFRTPRLLPRRQRSLQGAQDHAQGGDRRRRVETLRSDTSRPFDRPESGRIAVKVSDHLGDEVMKIFRVT